MFWSWSCTAHNWTCITPPPEVRGFLPGISWNGSPWNEPEGLRQSWSTGHSLSSSKDSQDLVGSVSAPGVRAHSGGHRGDQCHWNACYRSDSWTGLQTLCSVSPVESNLALKKHNIDKTRITDCIHLIRQKKQHIMLTQKTVCLRCVSRYVCCVVYVFHVYIYIFACMYEWMDLKWIFPTVGDGRAVFITVNCQHTSVSCFSYWSYLGILYS